MINIDAIKADREAGTPGPWEQDGRPIEGRRKKDGRIVTVCMMIDFDAYGNDVIDLVSSEDNANARRIARVPELENAVIALTVRVAALEAALHDVIATDHHNHYDGPPARYVQIARAALAKPGDAP